MLRLALVSALLILPLVGLSCASKEAISVSTSIGNVHLTIANASGGLVANLSGTFDLFLELGERASGPSDVSFSLFSVVRADTEAQVLNPPDGKPLSVASSLAAPVHLNPGDKVIVNFTITDKTSGTAKPFMELPLSDFDSVCKGGPVKIVGTIQDTGGGARSTATSSTALTPDGC